MSAITSSVRSSLDRSTVEKVAQDRNVREPRNARQGLAIRLLNNPANQIDLTVLHPDIRGDLILPDLGLIDAGPD